MPCIIEAWLEASLKITQSGSFPAIVLSVASLATKQELNSSADGLR